MEFTFILDDGGELTLHPETRLVVAGYTGRDVVAVQHHIDELAAIGIAPPPRVPMVYRFPLALLSHGDELTVPSEATSGEVEPLLVRQDGRWFLGVGSDHTDRGLERESIERSKSVCPKPVADRILTLSGNPAEGSFDAAWDKMKIGSWVDGEPYQSASVSTIRTPSDLLGKVMAEVGSDTDLVMFSGTVPLLTGAFVYGTRWRLELEHGDVTLRLDYTATVDPAGGSTS